MRYSDLIHPDNHPQATAWQYRWDNIPGTSPLEYTIDGLVNGTDYKVQARGRNKYGDWGDWGNWYPYWARGTPRTTPGAPWVQSASQGNGFLTVVWSHPANTGGVAITAYDLRYIPHDATDKADANWTVLDSVWARQGNPFRQYRLEGLTNGVFYDVQMRAVNIAGKSGWSNTGTGSPLTKSGAPSIDALAPGDGALTVAWTAPADNGGSSISAYSLRYIRGDAAYANWTLLERIWRSGSLEHTITGLINGVEYEVQVQARTRAGAGELVGHGPRDFLGDARGPGQRLADCRPRPYPRGCLVRARRRRGRRHRLRPALHPKQRAGQGRRQLDPSGRRLELRRLGV